MADSSGITDDFIKRFLETVEDLPKPVDRIVRSGEGGEHLVWIINDAFVLRVRADGQDNTLLVRERDIWNLLKSIDSASIAIPQCVDIGTLGGSERPYGLYRKLSGVSVEASPHSASAATESDLTNLLLLLKSVSVEKTRGLGIQDEEVVDFSELREQARTAWQRLHGNGHITALAREVNIEQALHLSEKQQNVFHEPVLLHADIKGEHIFVNPDTGHLTGVIDWSDACIGHPSVDIHGVTISVGATAAARIASAAGYNEDIVARGIFTARCDSMICLDAILHENDDSPEWLVRLQLQRALEGA